MIWCPQYWRESFWNTFSQITLIQLELNSFIRAARLYISTYLCLEFAYDGYCLSCRDHWAENTSALPCPSLLSEGTFSFLCFPNEEFRSSHCMWPGRGNRKWPSPSSGVVVVSVKSGGECGNRTEANSKKLLVRAALSGSGTHLLNLTTKPVWGHAALTSALCLEPACEA